jgi:hypothetical protein
MPELETRRPSRILIPCATVFTVCCAAYLQIQSPSVCLTHIPPVSTDSVTAEPHRPSCVKFYEPTDSLLSVTLQGSSSQSPQFNVGLRDYGTIGLLLTSSALWPRQSLHWGGRSSP